jgi:hypothetical protein
MVEQPRTERHGDPLAGSRRAAGAAATLDPCDAGTSAGAAAPSTGGFPLGLSLLLLTCGAFVLGLIPIGC